MNHFSRMLREGIFCRKYAYQFKETVDLKNIGNWKFIGKWHIDVYLHLNRLFTYSSQPLGIQGSRIPILWLGSIKHTHVTPPYADDCPNAGNSKTCTESGWLINFVLLTLIFNWLLVDLTFTNNESPSRVKR